MNNRDGWVRVCADDLSEFHRELIRTIPKYASIAVSELVLPARLDVLPHEEREVLLKERVRRKRDREAVIIVAFDASKITKAENEPTDALVEGEIIDGEAFAAKLSQSESFQAYFKKRMASKPAVIHRQPVQKARNWIVEFPSVTGKKGEVKTLGVGPQCLFRGDKLLARDSLDGRGTAILAAYVGGRSQLPPNTVLHTYRTMSPLWDGGRWDTCERSLQLTLQVKFLEDCEFSAVLHGKAVL